MTTLRPAFPLAPLRRSAVLLTVLTSCCVLPAAAHAVDLRADTNRDGVVDVVGASDEAAEAEGHSALFLANVDDDQRRCPRRDRQRKPLSDQALARCHDGADRTVNGAHDLLDLARARLLPSPGTTGTTGRVTVSAAAQPFVRLFVRREGRFVAFDGALTATEMRTGAELALEGTDVLRDRRVWDGVAQLSVATTAPTSSDEVTLRLAPLLTQPDTLPARQIFAHRALSFDADSKALLRDLDRARARAGIRAPISTAGVEEFFVQDLFKATVTSMPAPDGRQQTMRVMLRSANVEDARKGTLRRAGRFVFTRLRGRDVGAVQQVDLRWARGHAPEDTYNSTGNVLTIPPHPGFPAGRMLVGARPGAQPDPSFLRLLDAQHAQRPLRVDTSWLEVGHVDEVVSFVPASTPRGWAMVVADPRLGLDLLGTARAAGKGAARLREGKRLEAETATQTPAGPVVGQVSAAISVDAVLRDRRAVDATLRAVRRIDALVATIRAATGLADDEVVRVASLFDRASRFEPGRTARTRPRTDLVHFLPAIVNGQPLAKGIYAAPDPHGPVVGGRDVFKQQAERAFGAVGVRVAWIEDWFAHAGGGDVHCATNVLRAVGPPWWTQETDLR